MSPRALCRMAAVFAAVVLAMAGQPGWATSGLGPRTPIRHLVVMTQDQHSFDNYLGTRTGVDGIPSGVCLPARTGAAVACVAPFALEKSGPRANLRATAAAQQISVAGGRMDGFVLAQTTRSSDGAAAMGYYRPDALPVMTQLADQGVVFDHWFSSVPGGTIANRLAAISGTVVSDTGQVPAGGWPDMSVIFDRLQAADVSWKIYVEKYEPALTVTTAGPAARRGGQLARVPVLALPRYEHDAALLSHVVDLNDYYADLVSGALPAVSWIVTTASSERSPADPTAGQRVVRSVVDALAGSSAWSSSAFLLTYDSSGGWYDHVAPPMRSGAVLGLRVPTVLVSPYAPQGSVDPTVYDSSSVLRFIESNWSLAPLTSRDATATNLASAFSFDQPPRPASILGPADTGQAVPAPHRLTLYLSYLLALAAVMVILAWAVRGRDPRTRGPA